MLRRRPRLSSLALLACAPLLSFGCAASTYQNVPMPDVMNTAPAATMCRVVIARSGQMTGSVRDVEIRISGKTIGAIGAEGYMSWDLAPGRTVVQVFYNGPVIDGKPVEDVFDFEGEPGQTYYFRLHLDPKTKKPIFDRLQEEAGKAMLASRYPATVK